MSDPQQAKRGSIALLVLQRVPCALCFTCTFKLNATYLPVDYLEPGPFCFLHISALLLHTKKYPNLFIDWLIEHVFAIRGVITCCKSGK